MGRRIRSFLRFLVCLLILLAVLFGMFRSRYRDVIRELAETQVKNTTSDLANDAIARQIADGVIQYDRIVFFEKDLEGRITALKTNMSEVNRLKTDILNIINDEILALDTSDIGIPLGSLILPELFSGKGPVIPVHILSIRNSDAAFRSNFSQAGINQTIHQLVMLVSVDVAVLVLGPFAHGIEIHHRIHSEDLQRMFFTFAAAGAQQKQCRPKDYERFSHSSRRPSSARISVASSANSRWPPTGMP